MRRYEYRDEKSEKFWEIHVEGDSFTARYGKIGASGQTSTKTFANDEKAQSEADKMAAKKVKKGYVLVSEGEAPKTQVSGNPELEVTIAKDPSNLDAWQVYGDWLLEQGDTRGELVSIDCALASKENPTLSARRSALVDENQDAWLGKALTEAMATADGATTLSWKFGYLHTVRVCEGYESDGPDLAKQVRELLKLESAKFIHELSLGPADMSDGEGDWTDATLALSKAGKLHSLRRLTIGDFDMEDCEISWSEMGNVGKVWPCVPNLQFMKVHGGGITLGTVEHSKLRELIVETGGLSLASAKSLGAAKLPELDRLTVWFGAQEYGCTANIKAIKGIFAGTGLPKITHLGLQNSEFQDEIVKALCTAPIVKQLKTLDISMGTLSDEGGNALAEAADHFKHLENIELDHNFLSDQCAKKLQGIFGDAIIIGEQEDDDDGDYRYVEVGE